MGSNTCRTDRHEMYTMALIKHGDGKLTLEYGWGTTRFFLLQSLDSAGDAIAGGPPLVPKIPTLELSHARAVGRPT